MSVSMAIIMYVQSILLWGSLKLSSLCSVFGVVRVDIHGVSLGNFFLFFSLSFLSENNKKEIFPAKG